MAMVLWLLLLVPKFCEESNALGPCSHVAALILLAGDMSDACSVHMLLGYWLAGFTLISPWLSVPSYHYYFIVPVEHACLTVIYRRHACCSSQSARSLPMVSRQKTA
jgi:hypothetical protein